MAFNKKNLTAEVAENAEVEMAKCSGTGCKGKRGPLFHPSRKINTVGFIRSDLCALCLLFVYPLIFNPGGSKGKKEPISIE